LSEVKKEQGVILLKEGKERFTQKGQVGSPGIKNMEEKKRR